MHPPREQLGRLRPSHVLLDPCKGSCWATGPVAITADQGGIASVPDLEQIITAPAMQSASPDRSPAIHRASAPAKLRRFRKSRSRSPETGAIGTFDALEPDNAHHLLDTLDSCYMASSCKSGARTVEIAPCEENIARGPRPRLRREPFPSTLSMP